MVRNDLMTERSHKSQVGKQSGRAGGESSPARGFLGLTTAYSAVHPAGQPLIGILSGKKWLFLIAVALLSGACSRKTLPVSSPVVADRQTAAFINSGTGRPLEVNGATADQVIGTAGEFLGTPHCMGGYTRRCMDCSGLTYASFAAHDIELPRRSQEQARYGRVIANRRELRRGDLVFFTRSYNSPDYITHVGIYLGDNQFIHASSSQGVTITPLDTPWWSQRFVFGTRVF